MIIETAQEEGKLNTQEEREVEAKAIAMKIRELMAHQQVMDKATKTMRKLRYSDIAILTRSIKGSADVIAEVLSEEGIPAYVGTREGYFSAHDIQASSKGVPSLVIFALPNTLLWKLP